MAELVDALDSKSSLAQTEWGFDSPLRHSMFIVYILRSLKDNNLYIGMTKTFQNVLVVMEKGGFLQREIADLLPYFIQKNILTAFKHANVRSI